VSGYDDHTDISPIIAGTIQALLAHPYPGVLGASIKRLHSGCANEAAYFTLTLDDGSKYVVHVERRS
jgi:hypothetical protein